MYDFKVVRAQALLKFSTIAPIRQFEPPSILVMGEKLDRAAEVIYNGFSAPEFFISSPNRLIVRIPKSQIGKDIRDLRILSNVELTREDATLSLELTKPPKTVSGMSRLIQAFVLVFLSTPGSDIFNKSSGGGARSVIGRTGGSKGAAADLALAVDRTKAQLIQAQAGNPRIPPEERLLSATLSSVQFDEQTTTLLAEVDLRNALGDGAVVSIR